MKDISSTMIVFLSDEGGHANGRSICLALVRRKPSPICRERQNNVPSCLVVKDERKSQIVVAQMSRGII